MYNSLSNGNEALQVLANANPLLDRPITASGQPYDIHYKGFTLVLAVNKAFNSIYLYNENILFEDYNPYKPKATFPQPLTLAMNNALFKITPVNSCVLFGELSDNLMNVRTGNLFLTFGIYAYIPTLPDPYAANLGNLERHFTKASTSVSTDSLGQTIWLWLICKNKWTKASFDQDNVGVSFHFAPLQKQFQELSKEIDQPPSNLSLVKLFGFEPVEAVKESVTKEAYEETLTETKTSIAQPGLPDYKETSEIDRRFEDVQQGLIDYQAKWNQYSTIYDNLKCEFVLLDVSSNANQMGVLFGQFDGQRMAMLRTHDAVATDTSKMASQSLLKARGLRMRGLDLQAPGLLVRAFTLPQISWEPVLNLTPPDKIDNPPNPPVDKKGDPPVPLNYFPDDGGPTKIKNNSLQPVPVAPIPMSEFLVETYNTESDNVTSAYLTLPFGLRAVVYLDKTNKLQSQKPDIQFNRPSFEGDLKGGIQLQLNADSDSNDKDSSDKISNMFIGNTLQINNVRDLDGNETGASILGYDATDIFNKEFFDIERKPGVPLTRIDLSGYGASVFSDWIDKKAQIASTSQATFNVLVGRCSHEVIQVKSMVYPWSPRFVRTITLSRASSGYVYRSDSGWLSESDGKFDFRFKYIDKSDHDKEKLASPYRIHPGIVKGLFNIKNIRSADIQPFLMKMDIKDFYGLEKDPNDPTNKKIVKPPSGDLQVTVELQPVYFDADVELENVVQGQVNGRVPCKKILGFVQLQPEGIPLTPQAFKQLLERQLGSIGFPLDCVIDIGNNGQKMRVNHVDVNSSTDETNQPVFSVAVRGNVILPKDGSWSIVKHNFGTGEVTPLPEDISVPLIRKGELTSDMTLPDPLANDMILLPVPNTELLRIANPADLLRQPVNDTLNFGFLQSTNTQKVLFLTPAFEKKLTDNVPGKLLSKTPPLFADAYRIVNSKGIFPNIGHADNDFGDAIPLRKGFDQSGLLDGNKKMLKLMDINTADGITKLKEDGYRLLNDKLLDGGKFDLPSTGWNLIDEDYLKIYVEYSAQTKNSDLNGTQNRKGDLNFDINSFAKERWKSRLNNLTMVVDLGPFKRLLLIKGNFDAKKGVEASYIGDPNDTDFSAPQLEFGDVLKPVVDILDVLEKLQGGRYRDLMKKGFKIAMSNSADSWEYKFEASKEIPVVRFPPGDLYNSAVAPLKLEASLKVGVYFNAALTTGALGDPNKLLPTAGSFVDFYGRLSVMCVSLAALASVYALGQVNLRIAADTKAGPSLSMKFGFGAQIVVGLPVVGSVSVLFVVGVEIYTDSTKVNVSAFLLFQGHAELLGGIVNVTISIEAKGTVSKRVNDRTNCIAQVTFGLDISIFLVIDIHFKESWGEQRQIA